MPQRRRFDPWEAIRLRKEGLSLRAIGARLGVSNAAVHRALKAHGVTGHPLGVVRTYTRKVDVLEATLMRMEGHTLEAIAHRFSVSIPAIHHWLHRRPTTKRLRAGAS
jgi:transposase